MADDYEEKSQVIRSLASLPPDQMVDYLSQIHPNIDSVAPNIAPHIHSAAVNAVQFLNSKLPFSGNGLIQDRAVKASAAQKKQWLDLHETVSDPISVLEHVNNGTINRHHIEAMKSVYPDLHQEMVQKIHENLGELKMRNEELPYSKRVAISKFIGQPLDSTLTGTSLLSIIKSASVNTGPEAQANNKKASGAELSQINKVNQIYATPGQSRQMKK